MHSIDFVNSHLKEKNYYEGLDSFCTAWEKWQTYDKGRIKRIADIEKQIQEIEKQTEVNP